MAYFDSLNYNNVSSLEKGEYERCVFRNCDLSNFDFSEFKFLECEFSGCNLSMASLHKTVWRDVKFKDCKMLGMRFDLGSAFGLSFQFHHCALDHSSFVNTKVRNTVFKETSLQHVDFTGSDLTSSVFDRCDLSHALFMQTVLEKVDFVTSFGYTIDPELSRMRKAKFGIQGLPGLLDKYELSIDFGA